MASVSFFAIHLTSFSWLSFLGSNLQEKDPTVEVVASTYLRPMCRSLDQHSNLTSPSHSAKNSFTNQRVGLLMLQRSMTYDIPSCFIELHGHGRVLFHHFKSAALVAWSCWNVGSWCSFCPSASIVGANCSVPMKSWCLGAYLGLLFC